MKVNCAFHDDTNPSMEIYENGFYCFVCGAKGPLDKLPGGKSYEAKPKYVEDLQRTRSYIRTLPTKSIRGFPFPCDAKGFYITWPDDAYYKLRLFEPGEGPKYKNPSGHSQPPYWVRRTLNNPSIFVVEGEINALSVSESFPECDVVSPGSASDIGAKKTERLLTHICEYANIIIVVDRDPAGTAAAIQAKGFLLSKNVRSTIVLMGRDANAILVQDGKETLRKEIERGMQAGL